MRVAIITARAPFAIGGAEILADALAEQIRRAGHEAALVQVPFNPWPTASLAKQIIVNERVRVDAADKVIALKFPAYFVPHEDPVVWLLHQHRAVYDLYESDYGLPKDPAGHELRDFIRHADTRVLGDGRRVFASSPVTRDRLRHFNGIASEVLIHPINDAELLTGAPSAGYIFAGGRVTPLKRQVLLLEAVAEAHPSVRLVIAGPVDSDNDYGVLLRARAEKLGIEDRVELNFGFWPRQRIVDWINHAAACAYIPLHEDSMGYFAMEAAQAHKPVITTTDSGGVLDLVVDGETGWVAEPSAEALARAMTDVVADDRNTRERGVAQGTRWLEMDINWPTTVDRLLS